ncbi:MAG: hypothetical protein ABSG13_16435 [Bryobacteraceae bacterium]|jgi:hypothetical protein
MRTSTELLPTIEPDRACMRGSSREKWFAPIALVLVTMAAVALLYPR